MMLSEEAALVGALRITRRAVEPEVAENSREAY
jgi:hypothetical protein